MVSRREFIAGSTTALGAAMPAAAQMRRRSGGAVRRIATEEGFQTAEIVAATNAYMDGAGAREEPAFAFQRTVVALDVRREWARKLVDVGELRRREMDEAGVSTQILLLGSPGVQIFPAEQAIGFARNANEAAARLCRSDPRRFAHLAAIAPQSPRAAADELTRAVRDLGARGAVINSHTKGEYLDDPKFWPIFEAAQALDVPIYLHPREPSPAMALPFQATRVTGAIWGYAAEAGLHALRLILAGVFDQFPRLQIILGHAGESLPFFIDRIDLRFAVELLPGGAKRLRMRPSDYLRRNFIVTTSGMNWAQPVKLCLDVMGPDRVMFAVDWPFENAVDTVRLFDAIDLDPATRRRVLEGNAQRVFRLD